MRGIPIRKPQGFTCSPVPVLVLFGPPELTFRIRYSRVPILPLVGMGLCVGSCGIFTPVMGEAWLARARRACATAQASRPVASIPGTLIPEGWSLPSSGGPLLNTSRGKHLTGWGQPLGRSEGRGPYIARPCRSSHAGELVSGRCEPAGAALVSIVFRDAPPATAIRLGHCGLYDPRGVAPLRHLHHRSSCLPSRCV